MFTFIKSPGSFAFLHTQPPSRLRLQQMSALSNANLPCSGCHLILLTGFCSLISSFFLQVWFFCLLSPNSINIETCVKSLLSSHFFCLLPHFSHPFTVKPLEKVVFNHLFTSSSSFIFLSQSLQKDSTFHASQRLLLSQ